MTSLCKEYWQVFLAQGVLGGIGLGTMFLPAVGVIPHWFQRRRALATGLVVSGSSVGGICFPSKVFRSLAADLR
jgi:MFS family permease